MRTSALLVLLAGSAAPAFAAKTDVVVLVNGDSITCEIKSLDFGRLHVKTDDIGTIDIEWNKVASVRSPRTFRVETASGLRLLGSLSTNAAGQLEVTSGTAPVAIDVASVVSLSERDRRFWNRIDGSLDFGLSYTQSSGVGQLNFNTQATYRGTNVDTTASIASYFTRQPEADDTSRHLVQVGSSRRIRRQGLWLVQGGFERNEELGYKIRGTGTGGVGRYAVRSNRAVLAFGGGLSTSREVPVDGETTQSLDGFFMVRQSFFTYDTPKTDISTSLDLYPGLSQWGRVRAQLDARIKREIVSNFTVGFTLYDSYDNRPPTDDARKNDVGFSVTVGWTF